MLNSSYRRHPKCFFDSSAVQNKYESFHIFPFMSFPPTGMLRFPNGLLSRWLDWVERCVLSSHTSGFDSQWSLKIFRFCVNRLGCLFNCGKSFPVTYIYQQIKLSLLIFPLVFEFWHILWHSIFNTKELCFLSRYSNVGLWTEFERNRNFDPDQVVVL